MMKIQITPSGRMKLRNGQLALGSSDAAPSEPPAGTGATVLTLADIDKNMRLFQRDAAGGYSMLFEGTSDGTAPVQARFIDADTNAVIVDWTTIATPAGGTFSGRLRGPGRIQAYKREVRDSVNTAVKQTAANRFYIGAHGILWGQSNAVNWPNGAWHHPLGGKGALEYYFDAAHGAAPSTGVFRRMGYILDTYAPSLERSGYGTGAVYPAGSATDGGGTKSDGLVYIANTLSEVLGCAVCITTSATGGQALSFWAPGAAGWTNLTAALAAIGGDAEFAILYQGEADSDGAATTQQGYMDQLAARMAQFHSATGRNASAFKFGVVGLGSMSSTGQYIDSVDKVRAAQVAFANNTPGAFLLAANHDAVTTDNIHLKPQSFSHLGAASARTLAAQYGVAPSGAGPRVISATRSGAVITLNVQHAGGTALLDGAGGAGAALTGFRVKDGANAATISATAIASATTITLTLSAVPTGTVTVDYGMTPSPHHADPTNVMVDPVWASEVCDNVPLVNQVRGCLLQPFAALTVT